jgi:hypothetical protein
VRDVGWFYLTFCVKIFTKSMPTKTMVNGDIKTEVEMKTNEKGQKIKVTRRIKLINPAVVQRRAWVKFGECKGPDSNSTTIGDDVYLKLSSNAKDLDGPDEEELKRNITLANSKIVCRICGGNHWTSQCPFKDTYVPVNEIAAKKGNDCLIRCRSSSNHWKSGRKICPTIKKRGECWYTYDRLYWC